MTSALLSIGMAIVPWRAGLFIGLILNRFSLATALIGVGCIGWSIIIARSIRNA